MTKPVVRPESARDIRAIVEVNDLAFGQNFESKLVEKLRKSRDFIADLSLVAEMDGKIVGYVLFYPVMIIVDDVTGHLSLSLAPMSVHPAYQKSGIGAALVREGLKRAASHGFDSVVVVGHSSYYPKFGFRRASEFGLSSPFNVPDDIFMAIELKEGALKNIRGTVAYPVPFLPER